jgi:hypothetical protein
MEGYRQQKTDTKTGTLNVRCLCMPGLLKAVTTELLKYKLDFVFLGELRFKKVGSEWAVDITFFFFLGK